MEQDKTIAIVNLREIKINGHSCGIGCPYMVEQKAKLYCVLFCRELQKNHRDEYARSYYCMQAESFYRTIVSEGKLHTTLRKG